jgi:hypothetical protein
MKQLIFVLAIAILLAGSAVGIMSGPSQAQGYGGYNYPPPPQNPYATPWVGANTPWTYYNGDWFLNGILYYFLAITMDGPRITPMLRFISSDLMTGMRRGGIRGISKILITGRVLLSGIPIGAPTNIVSVITRIFIISTIVARVAVGIKASVVSILPQPLNLAFVLPGPLDPAAIPLGPPVRRCALLRLLIRRFIPLGPLVLAAIPLGLPVRRRTPL